MKKYISLLLSLIMLLFVSGCAKPIKQNEKIKIVCTVFPAYDWIREITGDKADITWLLSKGADMHSYEPTAADMIKIAECDLLVYIGGDSEHWVNEAVAQFENKSRTVISLIDALGNDVIYTEHKHTGEHHHKCTPDEHIWLSFKNAIILTDYLTSSISLKDSANSSFYSKNSIEYIKKLNTLSEDYRKTVNNARLNTLIFADRFPFAYLLKDYELSHCAAFPGCSAEIEASFETIALLSRKTEELGLNYIMTTETADTKIAETVISGTDKKDIKILTLDSMQSVNKNDLKKGTSYLSIAEENLVSLKKALS